MTIAEQALQLKQDLDDVYDAGYEKGKAEGGENQLYYAALLNSTFANATFSSDSMTIHLAKPVECYQTFRGDTNLKKVKIITDDKETLFKLHQTFRENKTIEVVDLTECSRHLTNIDYLFFQATGLKTILGALDLSECTSFNFSFFASKLEDIEIVPNTINENIRFNSANLTDESKQSIIDGLVTITDGVERTLTLDNITLDDEQIAIISGKEWDLVQ